MRFCEKTSAASAFHWHDDVLLLTIKVRPGARTDTLEYRGDAWLRADISAPARDGKANECLSRLVARTFGVAPRQVTIERGQRARIKRVSVRAPVKLPTELMSLDASSDAGGVRA